MLLIAMYILTIMAALSDSPDFMNYLMGSVGATIVIPVLLWLGIMFFKNKP